MPPARAAPPARNPTTNPALPTMDNTPKGVRPTPGLPRPGSRRIRSAKCLLWSPRWGCRRERGVFPFWALQSPSELCSSRDKRCFSARNWLPGALPRSWRRRPCQWSSRCCGSAPDNPGSLPPCRSASWILRPQLSHSLFAIVSLLTFHSGIIIAVFGEKYKEEMREYRKRRRHLSASGAFFLAPSRKNVLS